LRGPFQKIEVAHRTFWENKFSVVLLQNTSFSKIEIMQKIFFSACLLLATTALRAQNSSVGISVGRNNGSYYLGEEGIHLGAWYDYYIHPRLSLSFAASGSQVRQKISGFYRDNSGTDNRYNYSSKEQNFNFDLSLLYDLLANNDKIDVKIGGGISYALANVKYPKDLLIVKGVVVQNVEGTHKAQAPMANIVLEPSFRVAPNISVGLRGLFRTTGGREVKPLTITANEDLGFSTATTSSSSSIVFGLEYGLRIGYIF
jgi:hypothetical protein